MYLQHSFIVNSKLQLTKRSKTKVTKQKVTKDTVGDESGEAVGDCEWSGEAAGDCEWSGKAVGDCEGLRTSVIIHGAILSEHLNPTSIIFSVQHKSLL